MTDELKLKLKLISVNVDTLHEAYQEKPWGQRMPGCTLGGITEPLWRKLSARGGRLGAKSKRVPHYCSSAETGRHSVLTVPCSSHQNPCPKPMPNNMFTLLYLKWTINKGRELCSMRHTRLLCGSLDGRAVWGRSTIYIHIYLSPFAVHLKPSQHC